MGSVEGEKYCLKWNDFTSNLSTAFQELRKDEDFFDVTLLTEDSEIKCHKLVLGACSPHFRQIIKRLSSTQNPAIYLRGVRHEDIKNILEFMYLGEVNIAHEDLDSFLAVAQDLCIKGLTQDNNTSSQNHETPSQTPMGSGSRSPAPSKRPREPKPDRGQPPSKTLKREQLVQLKQEPQQHHEAIAIDHNIVIDNANDDEGNIEAYDEYYDEEATLDNPTGDDDNKGYDDDSEPGDHHSSSGNVGLIPVAEGVRCLTCGKTLSSMQSAKRHYTLVHATNKEDRKFSCDVCHQRFAVESYKDDHMRHQHGISKSMMKKRVMP